MHGESMLIRESSLGKVSLSEKVMPLAVEAGRRQGALGFFASKVDSRLHCHDVHYVRTCAIKACTAKEGGVLGAG